MKGLKSVVLAIFHKGLGWPCPVITGPQKGQNCDQKLEKTKKQQFIHSPISMACSITSLSGIKALGNKIELFRILTRHSFISFRLFLAYISSINLDMDCMLLSANLFNCPLSCFSNRLVSLLPEINKEIKSKTDSEIVSLIAKN